MLGIRRKFRCVLTELYHFDYVRICTASTWIFCGDYIYRFFFVFKTGLGLMLRALYIFKWQG